MNEWKAFLKELYLATDRWLQDNWRVLLYLVLAIWISSSIFHREAVDFEAISAHLN